MLDNVYIQTAPRNESRQKLEWKIEVENSIISFIIDFYERNPHAHRREGLMNEW